MTFNFIFVRFLHKIKYRMFVDGEKKKAVGIDLNGNGKAIKYQNEMK